MPLNPSDRNCRSPSQPAIGPLRFVAHALLAALLTAAPTGAAHADQAITIQEEARRAFDRGLEFVEQRAFEEALVEFARAYQLDSNFNVLFNLGQVYVALGRPVEAVDALRRYLTAGEAEIAPQRKEEVTEELARLERRVARLTFVVEPAGARLSIDGRDAGTAPLPHEVRVRAGSHTVTVSKPGFTAAERSIVVSGGQQMTISLALDAVRVPPSPSPPPPSRSPLPSTPMPTSASPRGAWPRWVLLMAVPLGATAAGLTLWNQGRYQRWQREDQALRAATNDVSMRQQQNNQLARSVNGVDDWAWGLGIGGAAALVAGSVALLWPRSKEASGVVVGLHSAGVSVSW